MHNPIKTRFRQTLRVLALGLFVMASVALLVSSCAKLEEIKVLEDVEMVSASNASKIRDASARFGDQNLVDNPSFESDLSGWEGWQSTLSRVSLGDAPDGSYVVKVTRSTGTSFTVDDNPATVQSTISGQKYWASARVKAASTSSQGKPVTLRLREINTSGGLVKETISQSISLNSSFQQLFITTTAVGSGNTLDMRISQTGAGSGDAFYADLFILEPEPTDNQIANPSFESSLSNWMGWQSTLSRVQLSGVDGDYVVKVTRSSGTSFTINDDPPTIQSTTAGQEYFGSVWVQSASSTSDGKTIFLRLREKDSGGNVVNEVSSSGITLANQFKQLTVTGTAQGTGNTIDLRISMGSAASGDAFYADLFVLQAEGYTPPPTGDPAEERPFDPDHPVYHPIPTNCPLYTYSSTIVNNIATNFKVFNIDVGGETPPIYIGQASDPIWNLTIQGETFSVHAPNGITPGTGSDYPLVILDRSSPDYNGHPVEYRMWQATVNAGNKTVTCNGGGVGVYANDGEILNDIPIQPGKVARALGQAEIHGQNTGSGCSYTVGMIRPIDIERGYIDHAIRVAIGYPHPQRWFWPALRTETWATNENKNCPMGARIFLDPSVDVDAIADAIAADTQFNLDAKNETFARMILVALQDYGMIALDGSNGHNIYMEADATANWVPLIGQKNGWGTYNDIGRAIAKHLPWSSLKVADPAVFDGYAHDD